MIVAQYTVTLKGPDTRPAGEGSAAEWAADDEAADRAVSDWITAVPDLDVGEDYTIEVTRL